MPILRLTCGLTARANGELSGKRCRVGRTYRELSQLLKDWQI
jgi:hypothetical protein